MDDAEAQGVAVLNDIAYVAAGYSGVHAPIRARDRLYDTPGEALYPGWGQYLYVADGHGGVLSGMARQLRTLQRRVVRSRGFDGTTYIFPAGAFTVEGAPAHASAGESVPATEFVRINHFFNVTAVYSAWGCRPRRQRHSVEVAYTV